jgi:hypothetical protein
MHTLVVFSINGIVALGILLALGGLGALLVGPRVRQLSILHSIGVGLGFLMLGVWALALAHVPVLPAMLIVVALVFGIAAVRAIRQIRQGNVSFTRIRVWPLIGEVLPLAISVAVALLAVFPLIRAVSQQGLIFGTSSLWNADISYYTLSVRSVVESGLGAVPQADWIISNLDLSLFTLEANSGASVFLALFSPIPSLMGQMGNVALVVVVALEWLALWSVATTILKSAKKSSPVFFAGVVATGSLIFGLNVQILGQQFLAQIIGTASAIAFISIVLTAWLENRRTVYSGIAVIAWTVIGVMTYATIWLPLAGVVFVAFVVLVVRSMVTKEWTVTAYWLKVLGAGAVVVLPVFAFQIHILITHSTGQFGWPMTGANDALSVFTAFDPHFPALGWPQNIQVYSWVFVFMGMLVATVFAKNLRKPVRIVAVTSLVALFGLIGASAAVFGWGDYRNWKAESYLMPIALVVFYSALVFGYGRATRWVSSSLIFVIVVVSWGAYYSNKPETITASMFDLATSPQLETDANRINVRLGGAFESMMIASIIPARSSLAWGYFPAAVEENACTLVARKDALSMLPGSVTLNAEYALAPWPSDCSGTSDAGAANELVEIQSSVDEMNDASKAGVFYSGWYAPEPGGVWSQGSSILLIPLPAESTPSPASVRIYFQSEPTLDGQRKIKFTSNLGEVSADINRDGSRQFVDVPTSTHHVVTISLSTQVQKLASDYRRTGIFVTGFDVR